MENCQNRQNQLEISLLVIVYAKCLNGDEEIIKSLSKVRMEKKNYKEL